MKIPDGYSEIINMFINNTLRLSITVDLLTNMNLVCFFSFFSYMNPPPYSFHTVRHECICASAKFIIVNVSTVCLIVCQSPWPLLFLSLSLSFTHPFTLLLHLRQKARLLSSLTSLPLSRSPRASPTLSCTHYGWIKLRRQKFEAGKQRK